MEQKIIFAGPVGAGKTTAVQSLSDIPVVSTDRHATDDVRLLKHNTTVAMDYGMIHLEDNLRVHLYGAPGQDRFEFMWDILTHGGIGLVLLLDYSRASLLHDLEHFLKAFTPFITSVHCTVVIGVTRMELVEGASLQPLRRRLHEMGLRLPIFEIDARQPDDVKNMVLALLSNLHPVVQHAPCTCCKTLSGLANPAPWN